MKKLLSSSARRMLSYDLLLPITSSRRWIFVLHDVSEENETHFSEDYYSTSPENFERQIEFIQRKFEIVPLDTLVRQSALEGNRHYASITFDDGFASVLENVHPVLSRRRIPFAVFVCKSCVVYDQNWISNLVINSDNESYLKKIYQYLRISEIDFKEFASDPVRCVNENILFDSAFRETYLVEKTAKKRTYLSEEAIKFLYSEGVLIGSHSADHYRLNRCTPEVLDAQVTENKNYLSSLLATQIDHFAIPFGKREHYDDRIAKRIFKLGHKYIYSSNPMPYMSGENAQGQSLIPRIGLSNTREDELMFMINRTYLKSYSL